MKRESVPVASLPGALRTKADSDREFKARLIRFGMAMKAKADGYDIEWKLGERFETWLHRIDLAESWAAGPRETL